jgi:hypothetical protein
MIERQKRLNEVYQYLRQHRGIHTKSDFAESAHYGRTSMSAALNGNESYLTNSLFKNICDAFPHTFNLQYLLTGEGELIADSEYSYNDKVSQQYPTTLSERQHIPQWADSLIDIIAKQIKENEALNRELRQAISEVNILRDDLQNIIKQIKNQPQK